jgi:ectoine hydroxylase-related dioxygenase (phytanoyl-CoA dioxygenase family)
MSSNFEDFQHRGYCIIPSFLNKNEVENTLSELLVATKQCETLQVKNKIFNITSGSSHHLPALNKHFLNLLDKFASIDSLLTQIFNGKYIINSFGGNLNHPSNVNYASNIHRDQRFFSANTTIILNTFIPLIDFNASNGATQILAKDVYFGADKPTSEYFESNSTYMELEAGSLCIFNSNLWHKAGRNTSSDSRPIITPMFSRPIIKQQYDYSSLFNNDSSLNQYLKQILGYNSRVPKNLEEWYVNDPKNRCYQSQQDSDL